MFPSFHRAFHSKFKYLISFHVTEIYLISFHVSQIYLISFHVTQIYHISFHVTQIELFYWLEFQSKQKEGLLPRCQHPITSSIKCYDVCVSRAFRTVMQSLADLLPRLPPGSDIQKVPPFNSLFFLLILFSFSLSPFHFFSISLPLDC